jgi:DNA recombination protein RmuC
MTTVAVLLGVVIVLLVIVIALQFRKGRDGGMEKEELLKMSFLLSKIDPTMREEFGRNRDEIQRSSKDSREEISNSFKNLSESMHRSYKESRDEVNKSFKSFEEQMSLNLKGANELQRQKFEDLLLRQNEVKRETELKLEKIREALEINLQRIQEHNSKKLEEMRATVDEKLQSTLEKRFNDSFTLISNRLDQVHQGLGEMQKLATGVGDLKKVLTNVKTRGNLGEIQLASILEEMFSTEQYIKNATLKHGSMERVEFAIKLPGRGIEGLPVLLPIDSKFPNEGYQRLMEAYDGAGAVNSKELDEAIRNFEYTVKKCAKDIREKYINPPITTDFAIMFVPTEGLYAEILRRTGLFELLQREYRVTVVGPANLVAFLSSLQMGFRTLAIEKRSSEVWQILGAVKTQFGQFASILEKTKKKLQEASNVIDDAGMRSRVIEKKLKNVQELPVEQSVEFLGESIDLDDDLTGTTDNAQPETDHPELPLFVKKQGDQ